MKVYISLFFFRLYVCLYKNRWFTTRHFFLSLSRLFRNDFAHIIFYKGDEEKFKYPTQKKYPARVGWLNIITTKLSWQFGWRRTCFASSLSLIPFRLSLVFRSLKGHVGGEEEVCVAQRYFVKEYLTAEGGRGGGARLLLIADDLVTLWECWLTMAAPLETFAR
jgi:hypothetical protein